MEQNVIDKLYESLEVDLKPGQGFKYVKTRNVLDRLNKAFKNNWGLRIIKHDIIDDEVLVLVELHYYDDQGNVLATQAGFGSAKKFKNLELGNVYKSATSRAIKSAARNWGVGLFLDEEDQAEDTGSPNISANFNTSTGSVMPNIGGGTPNTTSMPTMPTGGTPNTPSMPNATTQVPSMPSTPSTSPSAVPNMSAGTTKLPNISTIPGSPPAMPSPNAGNAEATITMVQRVAIESRLKAKGLTFEGIVNDFFVGRTNPVPASLEQMLYVDALDMVTFLNSK